jgi:hypothetical protein
MALLRQLSCDGGPDKSGRARNKNLHRASFGQLNANNAGGSHESFWNIYGKRIGAATNA